jgi:hypothetical protein
MRHAFDVSYVVVSQIEIYQISEMNRSKLVEQSWVFSVFSNKIIDTKTEV